MSHLVLLAVPTSEPEVARQTRMILDESDAVKGVGVVSSSTGLAAALEEHVVDVVVLHEQIAPLPVLDLARELNRRYPDVGIVLMAEESTPDLMRAAMFAGIRGVVALPVTVEELNGALHAAGDWAAAIRDRMGSDLGREQRFGEMVCVAGAKGGVGTTTLTVLLAARLAAANPEASICLVDLDLQVGDVRSLLNITHHRSILDLIPVVDELSTRHLDDALYRHENGLRVLLPPTDGELAEDIDATFVRRVLGRLRTSFDIVVVDLGAVMNGATVTAAELADRALIVTQTDVPALRGANRLLAMWERLSIRPTDVRVVVNRVDRSNEIQPELCGRVVRAPLARTTVPSRFRDLEGPINTGEPHRLDGPVAAAIVKLVDELAIGSGQSAPTAALASRVDRPRSGRPSPDPTAPRDDERRLLRDEAGQATVELVAVLPVLVVVLLIMWQIVLAGWTQVMVQNSAREAAHQLEISDGAAGGGIPADVRRAAENAVPGSWRSTMVVNRGSGNTVQVDVGVPLLLPGVGTLGTFGASAGAGIP